MAKNRVLKTRRDGVKQHYHVGRTQSNGEKAIRIISIAGGSVVRATKKATNALRDYRRERARRKERERIARLLQQVEIDHNSWAARRDRARRHSIALLRKATWGEQSFWGDGEVPSRPQPSEYVKILDCGVEEAVAWSRTNCPPKCAANFSRRGIDPVTARKLYEEAKAARDAERATKTSSPVAVSA